MRLRLVVLCILIVLIPVCQVLGSEEGPRGKGVRAPDMPRIAQNQSRSHLRAGATCDDCGEPGIEDPNWVPGACNCSRRCQGGFCKLAGVLEGCKVSNDLGGTCEDCVNCQL
jgi:hypothetical protein